VTCENLKNLKAKEKESKEGKFILLGVRNKVKERFSLLDVSYNNTQVSEIWVYWGFGL
jgi:hypothetical protein